MAKKSKNPKNQNKKKKVRKCKPFNEGSVDENIKAADAAMETLDIPTALKLYQVAASMLQGKLNLNLEGKDSQQDDIVKLSNVLAKVGEAKVSMGDQDGARDCFLNAISCLSSTTWRGDEIQLHETRASLHLYLGQLSSEQEALTAYKNGTQELEACISLREKVASTQGDTDMDGDNANNNEVALHDTRKQLCGAFCNLAELYMTDLCFEENAEMECESYIQSALKISDPTDGQPLVDALQALASLRLSQNRGLEAVDHILAVYDKMKVGCEALAALVGLGEVEKESNNDQAVELVEVEAANNLPGFEFRCQSSKILLECGAALKASQEDGSSMEKRKRCALASIQVLGSLMAENDEVIETWYLLGCAFVSLDTPNIEAAGQYWERAMEMLLKVKDSIEQEVAEGACDQEELEGILGQIEEVNIKLKENGCQVDGDEVMVDD
mmetsp:Transcript_7302/g.10334  ORF Transcript_7302/g.10334 Transcript_7302/m.10334 type:complete len:442 (+) Transcript_7302:44-1369(+)